MNIRKLVTQELPFLFVLPAYAWQILFLAIPLVIVIGMSFVVDGRFSLASYYAIINITHFYIIFRSLLLAIINAVVCLFIAYPISYFFAITIREKGFLPFLFFMVPFWTNFLVQIYAWFFLLERNGLINVILIKTGLLSSPVPFDTTMPALFMVMVYCYLPLMMLSLYATLQKLDTRLFEAAADLGATSWQIFLRVTLPLSLAGIKTGFLLVLVPSFGEFAIPSLLGGAKYMFVGSLISYYFLVARNSSLGAAFTVVSGAVLLVFSLSIMFLMQRLRSNKEVVHE